MKVVAGVTWVLTLSAGIGSASARAGARASGSSSNSILRDGAAFSSKRNEKLSTPHADSTAAKLNSVQEDSKESEIVTSVSGGQEVQTVRGQYRGAIMCFHHGARASLPLCRPRSTTAIVVAWHRICNIRYTDLVVSWLPR